MKHRRFLRGAGLLLAGMLLCSLTAFASDRYSNISSVRITVGDALKDLTTDDSLPSISAGDFSVPDSAKYYIAEAEWYNEGSYDHGLQVGDQPKIKLYLESKYETNVGGSDNNVYYRFSGSYNSSNVKVTNGEFVSATRRNSDELQVVICLRGIEGTYNAPENAYWGSVRGQARWSRPEHSSGYYEVRLKRGTTTVESIKTNALSLNLYPWMDREGYYTFEVRTIPYTSEQKKYGSNSDWAYSDDLYISDSTKSNGSGKYDTSGLVDKNGSQINTGTSTGSGSGPSPETTTEAGWIQSGSNWYFKYPNGELLKNQWLKWKDKWYRFDGSGLMRTGWYQNEQGLWFYLNSPNGDMRTGWLNENGYWYFLNTTQDSFEGSMLTNILWDYNGRKYYFDANGHMVTGWVALKDAQGTDQWYYFYPQHKTNGAYGYMAVNTTVDGFVVDASGKWVH